MACWSTFSNHMVTWNCFEWKVVQRQWNSNKACDYGRKTRLIARNFACADCFKTAHSSDGIRSVVKVATILKAHSLIVWFRVHKMRTFHTKHTFHARREQSCFETFVLLHVLQWTWFFSLKRIDSKRVFISSYAFFCHSAKVVKDKIKSSLMM